METGNRMLHSLKVKKAAWLSVNHCKYTGPSQIDFCPPNICVLIPVRDTNPQDWVWLKDIETCTYFKMITYSFRIFISNTCNIYLEKTITNWSLNPIQSITNLFFQERGSGYLICFLMQDKWRTQISSLECGCFVFPFLCIKATSFSYVSAEFTVRFIYL